MKIARINDLWLEIPDVRYSFFDTPYAPHKLGTAVDVYFDEKAIFPFEEGKLVEIRRIRTPRHIPVSDDYLLIFEVGDVCLKVLHVEPELKVGEKVSLGDEIGSLRLSGFFSPWSDKHAHFELRRCEDRYRARGGLTIFPEVKPLVPVVGGREFEVIEKTSYLWLKPLKTKGKGMTPFGNIEGGLPHYRYGAIFDGKVAELFGKTFRPDELLPNGVGIFKANFGVFANGIKVKGVGVYCNEERVKLIGGDFEVGDVVEIEVV
ncbi:hypothetical protein NF865_05360 [Thermococcus aggregans]|uniref:Peptidase M23 domain-containing protein n=1 Tax=Thermococcus aggregans TaxID=110163 RepID=A0A9E7MUZ1_THEAG|nr:hypothetical protein [Thermococcus aggregans]USS39813.1 hypothetical protein NF865_05360 [Thermococcus aggregans]